MENYNKKLLEYYSQWLKTIDKSFFAEHFSNPYFITAPTDWDNAKYRIMIIGEEGYGNWGAGDPDKDYRYGSKSALPVYAEMVSRIAEIKHIPKDNIKKAQGNKTK